MSRDELVFVGLVLTFAAFLTAHVALCLAIAASPPRSRAIAAFVVFPLAPFWGAKDGQYKRVVLWVLFGIAYVVFRFLAQR